MSDFLLRVKYSTYSTLVFVLVTHPTMMQVLQNIFGNILKNGSLTVTGYLGQVLLFFIVILSIMMFPKDASSSDEASKRV
jgi:ABC-type phosphate transport system permease subunit